MPNKLLVIESPNKIKTLSKYLGNEYEIIATVGHIRDLAKFGMGFDINTFEPKWVNDSDDKKKKIIQDIKSKSKKSKEIFIATDPDREGEAIAWHVYDILGENEKKKCKRITFNEISKKAIDASFENKRDINEEWVRSQFTRRILDRLIGFRLSQLVQSKLKAESAGRVQSVALKFIVEREREIEAFIPTKWFNIDVFIKDKIALTMTKYASEFGILEKQTGINRTGINFANEAEANQVFESLTNKFKVINISDKKKSESSPREPYKTSTLQQDCITKLNLSSKQVTSVAQKLYEGVEVDGNHIALITYPRTDSTRISDDFVVNAKKFIFDEYGQDYLGNPKVSKTKKGAQDAHEAIRPIDPYLTPENLKNKLTRRDWQVYSLIWKRTIAHLMANAIFENVKVTFESSNNEFSLSTRDIVFKGYQKLWEVEDDDELKENSIDIKNFTIGSEHEVFDKKVVGRQTSPPPRYNQASLIKALENAGIGRPSTYNSMANVALDRGYATLEAKSFLVSEKGKALIEQLELFFQEEINENFTRDMEERLDKIASGKEQWNVWLKKFSPEFNDKINDARANMEKVEDELVGRLCPNCNHELVYKIAKKYKNKFIGCSNFPECKYLESLDKDKPKAEPLKDVCPVSKDNLIVRKSNKRGTEFVACTGFPKCRYLLSMKEYQEHIDEGKPLPIKESKKK